MEKTTKKQLAANKRNREKRIEHNKLDPARKSVMLPPLPTDAAQGERTIYAKMHFLLKLVDLDGMPYHAARAAYLDAGTAYRWKTQDPEFSSRWDAIVVECQAIIKEEVKAQLIKVVRGQKGISPNAYVPLMFACKALAGMSDQPQKHAAVINVAFPAWIQEKLEARRQKVNK